MEAVTQNDSWCVRHIAGLPGGDQLDSNTVEMLLQTADVSHLTWLQGLLPPNRYDVAVVAEPLGGESSGQPGGLAERRTRAYDPNDPAAAEMLRRSGRSFAHPRWPRPMYKPYKPS
jgi:hypothetical protein